MKKIVLRNRLLSAVAVVCAVAFSAGIARAAVETQGILVQNANPDNATFSTTSNGNFTVPYTVQSSGTEVLVVGLYFDGFPGGQQSTPVNSLQFNGVSPAGQINVTRSTLAYFSVVPGAGTYNITGDTGLASGIIANGYVWELSEIDLDKGVDTASIAGTTSTTGSIDTTADRLITDFLGANKQRGTAAPQPGSVVDTYTALQFGGIDLGGTVGGGTGIATTNGLNTLGWTNATDVGNAAWGELAYAFAVSSAKLEINVNTFTGQVEIVNPGENAVAIDYYKITSGNGALNPGSWNSLDNQNVDAVGENEGQSWDVGPNASANQVIELYLDGQSSLDGSGGERTLGELFDPEVFGKRVDGDVVFQYGVAGQNSLKTGIVNYITPPGLLGDYNDDGEVNAADYTVYRNRRAGIGGTTLLAINEGATPGSVTDEDYQVWKDHYGETLALGSGSSVAESQNVPEPASLMLMTMGVAMAVFSIRRQKVRRFGR